MPLVRDRNFFHFGVEALMAYYELDEKSVEIGEDHKNIVIEVVTEKRWSIHPCSKSRAWKSIGSRIQGRGCGEKLYSQAKEFYNQENFPKYVSLGPR